MGEAAYWIAVTGGALGGIAVLRAAWARPRRSALHNLAGWALLALATVAGGMLGGAWGVAVSWMVAMAASLAVMAHSATTAPRRAKASAPTRQAGIAPPGEPLHLGRRTLTFLLVVPLALASSVAFAIGLRGALVILGAGEANANSTALFAVPLAWGVLATVVLLCERRKAQFAILSFYALTMVVGLVPGT